MILRDYQVLSLDMLRSFYASGGRKALLSLPTGAGKTSVFTTILAAYARAKLPGLMVVKGRFLVSQASLRLTQHGVSHGVIMGSNPSEDFIQAASVDTLYARKLAPPAKIIVIDECHTALSDSFKWLYAQYPDALILAVTATPFAKEGFHLIAEKIFEPINVRQLTDQRYLVPLRYFVPTRLDLSQVKKANGDYVTKDLGEFMNQARLMGPIVETWRARGEGRPTLCFCVDVAHSKRLAQEFNDAGIPALHIDARSDTETRANALDSLIARRIAIVCSVGLLLTGVDLPPVSCLIIARPTLSYPLWIQMLGRGTRLYEGKSDTLIFDHANNTETLGFFDQYRAPSLDGKLPPLKIVTKTCEKCFAVWEPNADPSCPGLDIHGVRCGHVNAPKPVKPRREEAEDDTPLEEVDPVEHEKVIRERWIDRTARECAEDGRKKGAAFYKIKSRYGTEIANASWGRIHAAYKE